MLTTFFRRYLVEVSVGGDLQLLNLSVGASGPIVPDSGMSVSLPVMDSLVGSVITEVKAKKFLNATEFATFLWQEFAKKISLSKLCLHSDLGWELEMRSSTQIQLGKRERHSLMLAGEERLLELFGASVQQFSRVSISNLSDLFHELRSQNWQGEIRDLFHQKKYQIEYELAPPISDGL